MEQNARSLILAQRIVAWHNRHPLARRITRDQVTGVGTVALPFVGPAHKAEAGNDRRSASGPASHLAASHAAQEAHLSAVEAELAASLGDAQEADQADPADEAAFLALALGNPLDEASQTPTASTPSAAPAAPQAPTAPTTRFYPRWHPLFWWSRLRERKSRGAATVQRERRARGPRKADWAIPVFSENFATPLEARAVARWSRQHARAESPDPDGEGPLREVPVDSGLRRVAMRGRRAALHTRYVSSAAIEWPDQRLRCLIGTSSRPGIPPPILGPRVWDPLRVGLAAILSALVLGGALALWQLRAGARPAPADPALAESSPAVTMATAASADAAVASSAPAASESPPASAPEHVAPAPEHARAAASEQTGASGASPSSSRAAAAESHPGASSPASSAASVGASAPAPAASAPIDVPITRADPRQSLQPALTDEERRQAREASNAARAAWESADTAKRERQARRNDPDRQPVPGVKAGAPTYALVMMPSPQREMADVQLSRLKSASTLMAYNNKMRFEVIESGGMFRATWYPFVDRKAAERTLVLLKGRGLAVELVEF